MPEQSGRCEATVARIKQDAKAISNLDLHLLYNAWHYEVREREVRDCSNVTSYFEPFWPKWRRGQTTYVGAERYGMVWNNEFPAISYDETR